MGDRLESTALGKGSTDIDVSFDIARTAGHFEQISIEGFDLVEKAVGIISISFRCQSRRSWCVS